MEYKNHSVSRMWRALGDPFLYLAIIRGAIQKGRLFSWIFCQFSPFRWSDFDLELIFFAFIHEHLILYPHSIGYLLPLESGICFKSKNDQTSIQRRLWRNFIQRGLVVPIFIHSRSLFFERNAGLVVPIFIHIIRDFPLLLFAFPLW